MAKLAILATILALSVAIATAYIEEETQCPKIRSQTLMSCERYVSGACECECKNCPCMRQKTMMREGRCEWEKRQCCEELKRVDEECACQAMKSMVQRIQDKEQSFEGEEMEAMVKQAMKMPSVCGVTTKPCTMRPFWF